MKNTINFVFLSNLLNTFISLLIPILIVLCITNYIYASSLLISDFDENFENWSIVGGTITHSLVNGNPNGCLIVKDSTNDYMYISTPANFHGNLQEFIGGKLSFDVKLLSKTGSEISSFGTVKIFNQDKKATLDITDSFPTKDKWTTYSVSLNATEWNVSIEEWKLIFSNVTSITLDLEGYTEITEELAFDNFIIRNESTECIFIDSDNDGVPDEFDNCPNSNGLFTDKNGCVPDGFIVTNEQASKLVQNMKSIITIVDEIGIEDAIQALKISAGINK